MNIFKVLFIALFIVVNLICFFQSYFDDPVIPLCSKFNVRVPESLFPHGKKFTRFRNKVPTPSFEWEINVKHNFTHIPMYHFINNLTNRPPVSAINSFIRHNTQGFQTRLSVFTNVFVSYQCVLFRNNNIYYSAPYCQSDSEFIPTKLVGIYSNVLSLCHSPMQNYARYTFDVFCYFLYIPQNILEKSTFITSKIRDFIHESLVLFNIPSYHILKQNEYVYALNSYSIEPHPCTEVFAEVIIRLREYIKQTYNLDREKPYYFAFLNRKKSRHISNLKQILALAKKKYPSFHYIYDEPFYTTYRDNAKFVNKIIVLFAPHGAFCVNLIFLQPKTVFIEIQADISGFNFFKLSLYFDIYHIIGRIPDMKHFGWQSMPFPVDTAMIIVDDAVKYLKEYFYNETRSKLQATEKLSVVQKKKNE